VDQTHSNGFSAWKSVGSPISPTPEIVAQIQKQDDLLPLAVDEVQIANNALEISLELQANSVVLFKLIKNTF
jgi:xylan 1,4-beta-xylosidase